MDDDSQRGVALHLLGSCSTDCALIRSLVEYSQQISIRKSQ